MIIKRARRVITISRLLSRPRPLLFLPEIKEARW